MISINNIKKTFGEVEALSDVSLQIENGTILGLIGSNGSGKSTLLRIMCGIYASDAGAVEYDGENVYENFCLKGKIVYLSDEQYFAPHASLDDMRKLYKSAYPQFDDERYVRMTELFGLDRARKISTFSKGMQKQSSLLLGLSVRPEFLLCDETFDGIDPVMRQLVRRIIADDVAENGLTAVISTHNLRELEDLCDHICLMHKGKILIDRELDDMKLSIHKIQAAFDEEPLFDGFDVISKESHGKLCTLICRGEEDDIAQRINELRPIYSEIIPLTLEEIFITEMEEIGYDSNKVIS